MRIAKCCTVPLLLVGMMAGLSCGGGSDSSPMLVARNGSGIHFFDDEIAADVHELFHSRMAEEVRGVRAEVRQGVVVLLGVVPSELVRLKAETLARQIPGVRRVLNRLRVLSPEARPHWTST